MLNLLLCFEHYFPHAIIFLSIFYLFFSPLRLAAILCSSMVPLGIVAATTSEDKTYDVNGLTRIWETCTKQEWYTPIYQTGDRTWPYGQNTELSIYITGKGYFYPSSPPGCAKGMVTVTVTVTVTVMVIVTVTSNRMKTDPYSSNHRTDLATVMTSEGSAWSSPDSTPTDAWTACVPSAAL